MDLRTSGPVGAQSEQQRARKRVSQGEGNKFGEVFQIHLDETREGINLINVSPNKGFKGKGEGKQGGKAGNGSSHCFNVRKLGKGTSKDLRSN